MAGGDLLDPERIREGDLGDAGDAGEHDAFAELGMHDQLALLENRRRGLHQLFGERVRVVKQRIGQMDLMLCGALCGMRQESNSCMFKELSGIILCSTSTAS